MQRNFFYDYNQNGYGPNIYGGPNNDMSFNPMNNPNRQFGGPINNSFVNPVEIPKVRSPLKGLKRAELGLGGRAKMSIPKMIEGANRTITTVNQVIPLYQQVKPFIENTKQIGTILTTAFKKKKTTKEQTIIEPEILDDDKKENEAKTTEKLKTEKIKEDVGPGKPFF